MIRLYPYKTLAGDVKLRITDGLLDDGEFPKSPFAPDQRLVQLYDIDKDDWTRVSLDIELTGPSEETARVEKEGGVAAYIVAHCPATQTRQFIEVTRTSPGVAKWFARAELSRDNFRGRVDIVGFITGTASGHGNRFLGESQPWCVHFDEPDVPPLHGTLRVRWEDFEFPKEATFLSDHKDQPFFSDLSGDVPTVYLNKSKDFAGLPELLEDRRKRDPWERALHDSERVGIARSVWMGMFNASLAAINDPEDYNETDPDWPAENWKKQVLQKLFPHVYPDISEVQALKQAWEERGTPHGVEKMESYVEAAVNTNIGAGKHMRRSLKALLERTTKDA